MMQPRLPLAEPPFECTADEARLRRIYGIGKREWMKMFDLQGGCCAVCKRSPPDVKLCVDHNHKTGRIRGLLCVWCNRWVIGRHTDSRLFHNASVYLANATEWIVPKRKRKRRNRKSLPCPTPPCHT